MFGIKKQQPVNAPVNEVKEVRHEYELKIKELNANHALALKEKEFEIRHFKDDEVKNLNKEVATKDQRIAVLEKENEMLGKITNLNADIIDIKDLVNKLVEKLPTINLSSLTLNNGDKK